MRKKRRRDDDLNEFLPDRPVDEGESLGNLEFDEVLDEEVCIQTKFLNPYFLRVLPVFQAGGVSPTITHVPQLVVLSLIPIVLLFTFYNKLLHMEILFVRPSVNEMLTASMFLYSLVYSLSLNAIRTLRRPSCLNSPSLTVHLS